MKRKKVVAALRAEAARIYQEADTLSSGRMRHHGYMFGQASGLRLAAELVEKGEVSTIVNYNQV